MTRKEFFGSMIKPLTGMGFVYATVIPIWWLFGFYAFVVDVQLYLGRWPKFGENLNFWAFKYYEYALFLGALGMIWSLYVAPLVILCCLFIRKFRHLIIYVLAYGAAVGIASGGLYLAPEPFLNWFFD